MREDFAFFQQKNWRISDIIIWNFNETSTYDVVSSEQPGPDLCNELALNSQP